MSIELFPIGTYIQKKIVQLFFQKGIDVSIGEIKIVGFSKLYLDQLTCKRDSLQEQFLKITSFELHISFWRSLWNIALIGEIHMLEIHGKVDFMSEAPLLIDQLFVVFKIRPRSILARLEQGNVSVFFQKIKKKHESEVYIELSDLGWNDIIGVLKDHLMSDLLKNSYSEDRLSVYGYLKTTGKNDIPFFNASIKSTRLSLYHKDFPFQKEKEVWVDACYLRKILEERINKNHSKLYVPYENISNNLVNAVICTEDPDFWNHQGISPFYIGYALRENLEKKKISRGASTITMQLVRNLFLSQNRTCARKAEESIIALLLENYYKISKETIIELYLNLIEFAPNVYGIEEASQYYFEKRHCDLSLTEIIILTYIIPRPKYFHEALHKKTAQLRSNLYNHINICAASMLRRRTITMQDFNRIYYMIEFAPMFGIFDLNLEGVVKEY